VFWVNVSLLKPSGFWTYHQV